MTALPLVRARYAHAFALALTRLGAPAERFLHEVRLPEDVLESPDGFIPAQKLWGFAGLAAQSTGIADLGLHAGQVPVGEHGEFGSRVVYAPTLYQAIETFCGEARAEYSRADFYLAREGTKAWFCRGPIDGTDAERQQVELYVLMLMVQTLRLAAGPWWQPTELRLQNNDAAGLADVELLRQANVQFGRPVLGIAFPSCLLGMPLQGHGATAKPFAQPGGAAIRPASDFLGSLRQVLHSFIRGGQVSIDTVAEIAGISVRTLQRRFAEMGLSYSGLLDEVRFEAAIPLLEDASIKMTDIAFDLGYSDPAHFARAFRRLAGVSPREFRRQRLETPT